MNIVFTDHALSRLERRKILREEVVDAIKHPDKIIKKQQKYYYQKRLNRGTIEISCERTERDIKVITIYWL